MPNYTPADFSEIHPAHEAPTKVGWYVTDHCLGDDTFYSIHSHSFPDTVNGTYWNGKYWKYSSDEPFIMQFGAVGCYEYSHTTGKWFGLKEPA